MTGFRCNISSLTSVLGGELRGQDVEINRLSPIESAAAGGLAFVSHIRYAKAIDATNASALIVPPALAEKALARVAGVIVTSDVYHYFALLTQHWKRLTAPNTAQSGVHPTAVIAPTARLGKGVSVGPLAVVGEHTQIADGVQIGAHSVLGRGVTVGPDCLLHARVTIADGCVVGARNIIHSGAVIGADGFGFAQHEGRWIKIEQLGSVRLGDDVEIGANTCIDRGALEDTLIGHGVKLDNLVQIGHNVKVGDHTAMAGCAGVAGSAVIGAHCTVGGGAVVLGHLSLADGVHVSAASVVMRSLNRPGQYTGVFPIDDNADWEKNAATLKQLHALRDRIKRLEKP